jgi:hypothetical protein
MRITGVAVMMAAAAISARAGVAPTESRELTICMETVGGNAAGQRENEAKKVASGIFADIGVKIRWLGRRKCPAEAIYISFSSKIPSGVHTSALAYALPYEGTHIVVFLDRVMNMAPSTSGCLLGYTLAHEITHILEG